MGYFHVLLYAILGITIVFWTICILILGSVPPISKDALTHHLFIPKLFLSKGFFSDFPELVVSYYPMNADLLFAIPLYFGKDFLAKHIHFGFGLLTALLIFLYLKSRLSSKYGLIGVVLFITLPIVTKLSITAYVDLCFAFFSFSSLLLIIKWTNEQCRPKYLIMAAICCGLCMGTKYNGLVVLFLLSLFTPYLYSWCYRQDARSGHFVRSLINGAVFTGIALIVFSPWMARNYHLTGNPLFPLFNNVFLSTHDRSGDYQNRDTLRVAAAQEALAESAHGRGPFAIRRLAYDESLLMTLLVPLRIFFQGGDENPRYFDGRLNPYLLILPLMSIFVYPNRTKRWATEKRLMLSFSALYLLIVFFKADMRIRYLMPIVPVLVTLAVFGLFQTFALFEDGIIRKNASFYQAIMIALVLLLILQNGRYLYRQFELIDPFPFLKGQISRSEYIVKHRPEYAAIEWANNKLQTDAKILCLFLGLRGYYFDNEVLFSEKIFQDYVQQSDSARGVAVRLKSLNITHLMLRNDLFVQRVKLTLDKMDIKKTSLFFRQYAEHLFEQGGYSLYRIK
jgi:4-amino-4-deoxy-L-arabinose transferase-like glycosyltransferase